MLVPRWQVPRVRYWARAKHMQDLYFNIQSNPKTLQRAALPTLGSVHSHKDPCVWLEIDSSFLTSSIFVSICSQTFHPSPPFQVNHSIPFPITPTSLKYHSLVERSAIGQIVPHALSMQIKRTFLIMVLLRKISPKANKSWIHCKPTVVTICIGIFCLLIIFILFLKSWLSVH